MPDHKTLEELRDQLLLNDVLDNIDAGIIIYDADGNYVDTVYLNSGVYYFHDEDIEWPEGYEPRDAFMDDYDYLNPT